MDKCPITGMPCDNPKVIHVTDIGPNYTAAKSYDLCQICGAAKLQQEQSQLPPVVSSLFGMLQAILAAKKQQLQGQGQATPNPGAFVALPVIQQPVAPPPQMKPPCPACGTTIHDIQQTNRLGCPQCYEWYKHELMPVLIHAHKATEHVGKQPKPKAAILEDMPLEEQIYVLEMQIKQAVEHEKYEKAGELKAKLDQLKATLPPEPPSE